MKTRGRLTLGAVLAVASGCNGLLDIPSPEKRDDTTTGAGGAPNCAAHADCMTAADAEENPQMCVSGQCVPVLTPECPLVLPRTDGLWSKALKSRGPEPLIVGALTDVPLSPAASSSAFSLDYDLVLTEVSHTLGGIPAGGVTRPVLAVGCANPSATTAALDRAVDHLTEDLGVPAVFAALDLNDLEHAFERSAGRDVFYLNLRDGDPSLVALPHHHLMWHMLAGWDSVATAYQPLLERALRHLSHVGSLDSVELPRIALVASTDYLETSSLAQALWDRLRVNGQAPEELGHDHFRVFSVPSMNLLNASDYEPVYGAISNALRNFAPHVIIATATDEFTSILLPNLEAGTSTPAPFYLLSPANIHSDSLANVHALKAELYERVAGVNFSGVADPSADNAFQTRFAAAYPDFATAASGTENHYDGPYYLLYAAAGARSAWPLTGPDFALGMLTLLSGERTYTVGPDDLASAMSTVESNGSGITLNGTMGPPNFDPTTGTRKDPGTVWCIDADGDVHADALRLDASNGLVGTFPCFDFED